MPVYPDIAYVIVAPDWVCEVLSPGTRKIDLYEKRPIYIPGERRPPVARRSLARSLEAFELRDGRRLVIATLRDDDTVSVPPFKAPAFSLGDLWADSAAAS